MPTMQSITFARLFQSTFGIVDLNTVKSLIIFDTNEPIFSNAPSIMSQLHKLVLWNYNFSNAWVLDCVRAGNKLLEAVDKLGIPNLDGQTQYIAPIYVVYSTKVLSPAILKSDSGKYAEKSADDLTMIAKPAYDLKREEVLKVITVVPSAPNDMGMYAPLLSPKNNSIAYDIELVFPYQSKRCCVIL